LLGIESENTIVLILFYFIQLIFLLVYLLFILTEIIFFVKTKKKKHFMIVTKVNKKYQNNIYMCVCVKTKNSEI